MEEADGVVDVEVEQATQVPKACIVEDRLIQGLEAGTVEDQVYKLFKACKMGNHPDQDLKAGQVEDKVDNKAQNPGACCLFVGLPPFINKF